MADNGHSVNLAVTLPHEPGDPSTHGGWPLVVVLADIAAYWAAVERGDPRGRTAKSTGA